MQPTEPVNDVIDAFGEGHVSPIDRHSNRFPYKLGDVIGEGASVALAVAVDELVAVNARYRRFPDTCNDCFVDRSTSMYFRLWTICLSSCRSRRALHLGDSP